MIKNVARKSAADAAGLKPHDVILEVGGEAVVTSSDWERLIAVERREAGAGGDSPRPDSSSWCCCRWMGSGIRASVSDKECSV
jgi:hypothetical protein